VVEFSWTVLLVVFAANAGYMAFMYFLQAVDWSLPPRHSVIPGTAQKFIYMQDFHTCSWGDFFAIPLIANAFVLLAMGGYFREWLVFSIIVVADGAGFWKMCLGKDHKPDQGYPKAGKISWNGFSHLPYHGVGVAMSLFTIWHAFAGELRGPVLYLALAGGVIYIASFITDIKSGNFDPLKRI